MRSISALLLLPLVVGAPVLESRGDTVVPGSYVVVLKEGASSQASVSSASVVNTVRKTHTYNSRGFKGFAAKLSPSELEALQKDPQVDYIEQDAVVTLDAYVTQSTSLWGLGRLSTKAWVPYPSPYNYTYDSSGGSGTCSYVIDTGIWTTHSQFGGRAYWLANFIDSSNSDGYGHGTHVASTLGGSSYGVAKQTTLFAVKVLNDTGSGTVSSIIAGMDFVAADTARSCPNGRVANMSLGKATSAAINAAATALVNAGVFLVVSAGNENMNAAGKSPASAPLACTVGASNWTDFRADFSNYGSVVDVFAPGKNIFGAWRGNVNTYKTMSGTSSAAPHVAGLGAYLLTLLGPRSPTALCEYIKSTAQSGKLGDIPAGTNNLLAFNGNPSA